MMVGPVVSSVNWRWDDKWERRPGGAGGRWMGGEPVEGHVLSDKFDEEEAGGEGRKSAEVVSAVH